MDTALNIAPATVAPQPIIAQQIQPKEKTDQSAPDTIGPAPRPTDAAFVAQVVTARLAGGEFPKKSGEITPPNRTLKPYDVPMLPYDKEDAPV